MSSRVPDQRHTAGCASTPLGQRKVAIPRLQKVSQANGAAKHRRRVTRACTGCRSHKIKCTGERPSCKHCATTSRECVYIMPRKDRLKIVTEQCQQMAGLLRELRASASNQDCARITDLLEAVEEDTSELREPALPSHTDTDTHGSQGSREFSVMDYEDELDTESLDLLDENLHEDERARATGFVGKNSEVQWLRTIVLAQNERGDDDSNGSLGLRRGSLAPSNELVSSFSYWIDDENIHMDAYVDPYELPRAEMAERLLQCYMLKVHDSFPILPRQLFEHQFRMYFRALQNDNAPRLSPKWQAILNLVFAIGAKYSHLVKYPWRADERDHLIYHARARAFGLNESTITSHPDIPQIQSLGLLAFYWLSVGQVSRAWTMIGMALRSAYSLGLHVRNEDPSATAAKREALVRTWWSLYSLERTLSIVTGRPSIIVDSCCSVPLPVPVPEESISDEVEAMPRMRKGSMASLGSLVSPTYSASSSSHDLSTGHGVVEANSGSYFKAVVQLSIISQSILTSLYSAGTMIRQPAEIQHDTVQLLERLEHWLLSLPREFNIQGDHPPGNKFSRERLILGFQFCSAKILLSRPFLAGRRQSRKEFNENGFTRRMANMCVDAAKTVVTTLPDQPQSEWVYDQGPWWCVVHHLMQAISVFLLALSFPSSTAHHSMALVYYVKKAVRWLQAMQDPVADRAHLVALNTFQSVAHRCSIDISDLWLANGQIAHHLPQANPEPVMNPYFSGQYVQMAPHPAPLGSVSIYEVYETMMSPAPTASYATESAVSNEDNHMTR